MGEAPAEPGTPWLSAFCLKPSFLRAQVTREMSGSEQKEQAGLSPSPQRGRKTATVTWPGARPRMRGLGAEPQERTTPYSPAFLPAVPAQRTHTLPVVCPRACESLSLEEAAVNARRGRAPRRAVLRSPEREVGSALCSGNPTGVPSLRGSLTACAPQGNPSVRTLDLYPGYTSLTGSPAWQAGPRGVSRSERCPKGCRAPRKSPAQGTGLLQMQTGRAPLSPLSRRETEVPE